jgi:non-specific serine/threonine protein kinase
MIGKTVSHYQIIEELGCGGMGVVYKAQDTKLDRFVALKFLPVHLGKSKEEKERFIHEAKAASALQHNNLCTIHEIDETEDGQMFICLDYYEGNTLDQKIKEGPLPLNEVLDITIQMAYGLDKAHKKEIVHRDIKPGNILITNDHVVKILDFGLAKLSGYTQLTKTETTLGTVSYMSPEQAKGQKVDHRSDIWSLGIVLYEMITGKRPFKGDYDQAVIYSIINEEPEPLTGLRTGVPLELERIVKKALIKNPNERYQHVDEMLVDLKRIGKELESGTTEQITDKTSPSSNKKIYMIGAMSGLFLVLLLVFYFIFFEKSPDVEKKSIAVLPFENLSKNENNDYFSDGITEDVIAQLSKIRDLKVISRTSVMLYKERKKSLRVIGEELGVATVLEGSVRRVDNRVRIVSQLIDAKTDDHLWTETYDRDIEDIFAIQSDVAQKIASALKATLTPEEKKYINQKPTDNLEAYDYFIQAKLLYDQYFADYSRDVLQESINMYEKAIELDPQFALAYALLAYAQIEMWQDFNETVEEEYLESIKNAIEKAKSIDPDLAEIHLALGRYYTFGEEDVKRALKHLHLALEKQPNNSDIYFDIGNIQRFNVKWQESNINFEKALELNPRDIETLNILAVNYIMGRINWSEAERLLNRSLVIAPEGIFARFLKAFLYFNSEGNINKAREILDNLSVTEDFAHKWYSDFLFVQIEFASRDYPKVLELLNALKDDYFILYKAKAYRLMGNQKQAKAFYDSARIMGEEYEKEEPDDLFVLITLGRAYAGLERREDAIRMVERITVEMQSDLDLDWLTMARHDLAEIYILLGDYDAALDQLEIILTVPGWWTAETIKLEPLWDPLQDHPRFKKLIEGGK